MKQLAIFCLLIVLSASIEAVFYNEQHFSSIERYQRYQSLIDELRCLVCQNQNLASSDAELAANLRTIIVEHLEAGKSDDQIRQFMVERYGNFVLYDPPFIFTTILLWLGPLLLLAIGAWFIMAFIRRQSTMTDNDA